MLVRGLVREGGRWGDRYEGFEILGGFSNPYRGIGKRNGRQIRKGRMNPSKLWFEDQRGTTKRDAHSRSYSRRICSVQRHNLKDKYYSQEQPASQAPTRKIQSNWDVSGLHIFHA